MIAQPQFMPSAAPPSGSARLTFIGFDLAGNPDATAVLEQLARASGGRLLQADDQGALAAMLQAGVTGTLVGGGGGGGLPYVVRDTPARSPLGVAAGLAIAFNLLLLVALVVLRSPTARSRAAALLRRGGRTLALMLAGGLFLLSATPVRAGIATPALQPVPVTTAAAPVLLIPGIFGSAESLNDLSTSLATRGWRELPVFTFAAGLVAPSCLPQVAGGPTGSTGAAACVPWDALAARAVQNAPAGSRFLVRMEMADNAQLSFAEQGERVRVAISALRQATGAAQVRLAGHSMGGLAARAYLQGRGYAGDVEELITIATPHGGSLLPYAEQIYSGEIPDLTAPLPIDQFRPQLMSVSFTDAAGAPVAMVIPGALANDNGQRRLYGMPPSIGFDLYRTLHDPTRRLEAYTRVIRELATLPRVRARPSWVAARLARVTEQYGLGVEAGETLLAAIEAGGELLPKQYVRGGTLSASLRNATATLGRRASSTSSAFAGAGTALSAIGLATEMSDALAGALLLRALATDEALERVTQLRTRVVSAGQATGMVDPLLDSAFSVALDELVEAQRLMKGLVNEVAQNAGSLATSAGNVGVSIASYAGKLSAKGAIWIAVPIVAYDVSRAISDQWELAQEASLMATLALQLQQVAPDDPATVAYAQRAFFEMMAEALSARNARLADALRPGAISRELSVQYRADADRLRLLGPVAAPCGQPTSAASLLRVLLPAARAFLGVGASAPTVRRLAPDAPELRALNTPGSEPTYRPLPTRVRYVTVIADAGTSPLVPSCALRHWQPVFEASVAALSQVVQGAGATVYRLDPSQVPMSAAFVLSRTDLVVPVPLQTLGAVRAGWGLQPQVELVTANHFSVMKDPAIVALIDRRDTQVASGPTPGGLAVDRVLLVQDVSSSMDGRRLDEARAALRAAVRATPSTVQLALHEFGGSCKVREVIPFTHDHGVLERAIDGLKASGSTPLFEAMQRAAEVVRSSPTPKRVAVVIVSDGAPTCNTSRAKPADVARELGLALRLVR